MVRTGMKRLWLTGVVATLAAAAGVVASPAAYAAARNGVCDSGEFCLYYNSGNDGSLSDFAGSIKTYGTGSGCYKFLSGGQGQGKCVKNDAASVWNRRSAPVTVFYKSGYAGALQSFGSDVKANFNSDLKNENAGHLFASPSRTNLSFALYQAPSRITAGFDGYLHTAGRHEGIDISHSLGAHVYAVTTGTVTNVEPGSRGTDGLSTIAVFNAALGKTVIYLHTNPNDGLHINQSIDRGQFIAVQDWRGVSSEGGSHTHVEMRPGRQTHASKSVGDPVLDNPNPTTFWKNRDYNICCS